MCVITCVQKRRLSDRKTVKNGHLPKIDSAANYLDKRTTLLSFNALICHYKFNGMKKKSKQKKNTMK